MTYFEMNSPVGSAPARDEVVSLADQAYNRLLEMILGGKIAPGTPLQERNLADWLAMSRTPLREALSRLEAEQFIIRAHGRAPVVRAVGIENFVAILDMRRILEVEAAWRAAGNLPASVATQLFDAIDKLVAIETPTPAQHWAVDNLVHETIADTAGNPLVAASVRDLRRRTRLFNTARLPQRLVTGASEHRILIEAIMAGNADKARLLMGRHLDNVKYAIITYLLRTNCD
ncbi:GntR family transcriptional regulator [Devosia crocina]|nr:GntR family transcriptional regulator [Devosia crocina]